MQEFRRKNFQESKKNKLRERIYKESKNLEIRIQRKKIILKALKESIEKKEAEIQKNIFKKNKNEEKEIIQEESKN